MTDGIEWTSKIKICNINFVSIVQGLSYCVKDGEKLGCTGKTIKEAVLKVIDTILCKRNYPTRDTPLQHFRKYRSHLSENINDISHENIDDALKSWKNDFLEAVNVFVPRRKIRHSQSAPWIDCDLAYAIKKKKHFWNNKVRRSNDPAVFEEFRKLRQRIKNWIRANRKSYFKRTASEIHPNAKPFWSFFKLKSGRRSYRDTMLLESNIELVTSDLDKAIAFSDHFQSIFTDHSLCSFRASNLIDQPSLSGEIVLSVDEVLADLKGLNIRKATGSDEIPTIAQTQYRKFVYNFF